jgi:hypothetical protein
MHFRNSLGASALAAVAALSLASPVSADPLFSDPGESLANFTRVNDSADTTAAANVDYGALGIPEAPHQILGSAAFRGIQLTANKGDTTATTTGLNLILGATPQTFTGTHTFQFDVWMNVPSDATATTEGFLGGTARSTATDAIVRNFRTSRGNGAWFYATGDNGNATDDFAQLNNGSRDVVFADTTDTASGTKYDTAFTNKYLATDPHNDAANEWVQVSIVQDGSTASVYLNGVLFSTNTSTNTSGFAWLGYEDMFGSIGSNTLYGIFDNIQVVPGNALAVPEPTSLAGLALGGLVFAGRRRRRA